ncbi:hypothetical protein DMN91_010798 [Ooceraea biroi]|uniref:Uncharacterized protein n=1 Tax=Ooceraea biroi TaxID=2015173 RepID=A0A3L8D8A4_OOCBI|nr:hypothetical protein DMN91_010798 [Ooceraea biroi]
MFRSLVRKPTRKITCNFCRCVTLYNLQVTFGIGVYVGIFMAQNYEIPRVDEPAKLYDRVMQFLEENKKKP